MKNFTTPDSQPSILFRNTPETRRNFLKKFGLVVGGVAIPISASTLKPSKVHAEESGLGYITGEANPRTVASILEASRSSSSELAKARQIDAIKQQELYEAYVSSDERQAVIGNHVSKVMNVVISYSQFANQSPGTEVIISDGGRRPDVAYERIQIKRSLSDTSVAQSLTISGTKSSGEISTVAMLFGTEVGATFGPLEVSSSMRPNSTTIYTQSDAVTDISTEQKNMFSVFEAGGQEQNPLGGSAYPADTFPANDYQPNLQSNYSASLTAVEAQNIDRNACLIMQDFLATMGDPIDSLLRFQ